MADIVTVVVTYPDPIGITDVTISGATGPAGTDGADGEGVPVGGTTGQVLAKASGTDYDTEWTSAAGGVSDGDKGQITVSSSGTVWTIDAGTVTLAQMANLAASKLIGRYTGSTGVPETITVGTDFSLSGGTLSLVVDPTNASLLSTGTLPDGRFPATLPAASGANLTALNASNLSSGTVSVDRIGDATVTLAKLANLTQSTIVGRHTASTGVPEAITIGGDFSLSGGTLSLSTNYSNADNLTSGTVSAARIGTASVTLAKMADLAQSVLIGRYTASTGVPETIAVGGDFSLSGGTLSLVVNPTNASNLASGTMADARLSSNVPLENAACDFTVNSAASTPAVKITGTTYTGGTATTTTPHFLVEPTGTTSTTWSTSGTIIGGNAASGFVGNLIDIKTNNSASGRFWVTSSGQAAAQSFATNASTGYYSINGDTFLYRDAAAAWQLGNDAASPVAQTLKGCDSRAGTDTNTAGGVMNIAAGRGTGTAAGGVLNLQTAAPTSSGTAAGTLTTRVAISGTAITASLPIVLQAYTVATLPTGVTGMRAYVTDATAPTYLGALTGGGAVVCPVFFNGSSWISA